MDEYRVAFANGRQLACPSVADNPDGADYLRVLDATGAQLALSTSGRLRRGPGEMTRIMDALTDGRPAAPELTDPEWGAPECVMLADSGLQLRLAAGGQPLDYLRICHPDGSEMVYWSVEEWVEDAELVMGAFMGSLTSQDV